MLATVLARQPERLAARVAQWRQLLDLVAQHRLEHSYLGRDALDRLAQLRAEVPVAVRRDSAFAIAGRPVPPMLVAFLAADVPQVAGEILSRVQMGDEDWLHILPRLSPTGRGFLRHRSDLSPILRAALAGFGASDLTLAADPGVGDEPPPIAPPVALVAESAAPPEAGEPEVVELFQPNGGEGQIRAIISRIARFRTHRAGSAATAEPAYDESHDLFHFETGSDGVIRWIEGVPREALIGATIARPADGAYGVDAQAPGAFRRRGAFRDARLLVAGGGATSGEWRIAGVPAFAPQDGRFLGYRGTGRRPRLDERAETLGPAPAPRPAAPGLAADSLRQLVHELRTPLNAIGGFAEMIRRQMRGPVSSVYRDRAQRIAEQAAQLLAAVDDLDVAARLDGARLELQRAPVDVAALLSSVCADQRDLVRDRGAEIVCEAMPALPRAIGDAAAMRRMIARLIASSTAIAETGERFTARLGSAADGGLELAVTRPARLKGVGDAELLDPGYGPEGEWPDAPLLGLGFSLHLVRRLASAAGCALMIGDAQFTLRLPADDARTDIGTGV
jgi:signal transduction histidine kinase